MTLPFFLALIAVLGLCVLSLFTGVIDIGKAQGGREMFFITRIPRTAALMLTGMAMSISGMVMQFITQNKMVEPTTAGTLEWAGLGLVFCYMITPVPSLLMRMSLAILFSFGGTMVFFLFLQRIRLKSSLIVPIVGIMLGAVISSLSTFLGLQFQISQIVDNWFIGSFSAVQIGRYEYLWGIVVITILIYLYADKLAVAGLGKDVATGLGVNYEVVVLTGTALLSLAVGIVSAVIGNLPFLGLIVPNIVSIWRGDDLRSNLPWVCLLETETIVLCDILSRTLIMPFEIPVSLILGCFGSIVFIIILLRQRRIF